MHLFISKNNNLKNNMKQRKERMRVLTRGKVYINICVKGLFINNYYKLKKTNEPIISVIIPVYNSQKTIRSSIRSIQNQNISEIEIILVNDFSNDNTLNIIKIIKNQDPRITVINNNRNMGTLYSRSIGTLISKGKYIFALDNDDMFFNFDIFYSIHKIAEKEKFDIIGFKSIYSKAYYTKETKMIDNYFSNHENNLILHQPELGIYPISKNGIFIPNDYNIWGKCIKSDIYKNSINSLGIKRYSIFMSWNEDSIMIFIIFNFANSFKFIHKYGIIHFCYSSSSTYTQPEENKLFGELFLLDIILDFSKNKTYKNLAVSLALNLKRIYNFKKILNKKNYLYLKIILKKIINNINITPYNKELINKNINNFKFN